MASTEYLRVKEPFVVASPKGEALRRRFNVGDIVAADDPIVKGREKLLEPIDAFLTRTGRVPVVPQRQARKRTAAPRAAKPAAKSGK